jgi:hypothetical protein
VPHFSATVDRDGARRHLTSLTLDGVASGSYWSTRALFKIDHDFVGWDFEPPRETVASKFLLHTVLVYMNSFDEKLAAWLSDSALANGREGAANLTEGQTTLRVNSTRPLGEFHLVDGLSFIDHWRRVGGLGWTPNVSVWPTDASVKPEAARARFQVLGGSKMQTLFDDRVFRGLVLSGGFVYPAGYRIYHDPQLETSSAELEGSSALPAVLPALILLGEVALIVGGLAAVLALAARASSKAARAQAAREAQRLEELKRRYRLPPGGGVG